MYKWLVIYSSVPESVFLHFKGLSPYLFIISFSSVIFELTFLEISIYEITCDWNLHDKLPCIFHRQNSQFH
eukprot:snap_masked-scaffold_4-processed-gene-7.35-mRNA-1 protein AED:1.00 eAED:1.00 QI:0/0/0/0/1/1/2/0/70